MPIVLILAMSVVTDERACGMISIGSQFVRLLPFSQLTYVKSDKVRVSVGRWTSMCLGSLVLIMFANCITSSLTMRGESPLDRWKFSAIG